MVSLLVTGVVLTVMCQFRFAQLAGLYSLVQSLSYLLIYAALFRLRSREGEGTEGFRIPVGTFGLALMAAPSVALVTLVVRQGLWPGGVLNTGQALLDLALFTSGPLTYVLFRSLFGARARAVAAAGALLLAAGTARAAEPDVVRVGMDTRSRPWVYVPGLDYSREDWTKAPLLQPRPAPAPRGGRHRPHERPGPVT